MNRLARLQMTRVLSGGGGGAAAPVVLISDTFTGADGTSLNSHAPDVNTPGDDWDFCDLFETTAVQIQGNAARLDATGGGKAGAAVIDTGLTAYTVSALFTVSAGRPHEAILVRGTNTDNDHFKCGHKNEGTGNALDIMEGVTVRATTPHTWATGQTFVAVVTSAGITFSQGATSVSYVSTTKNTNTHVGIFLRQTGKWDDFLVTVP